MMKKTKLWAGLTAVLAFLLVVLIIGNGVANSYAEVINGNLGIATSKVVETGEAGETMHFKSAYGDFTSANRDKLVQDTYKQNIAEMEEGAALLYNPNGALPIKDAKRITVLGHASIDPAYQSNAAGTKVTNSSAGVVTLPDALQAAGYEINPTVLEALKNGTAARGEMRPNPWGGGMQVSITGSAKGSEENDEFYAALADSWANDYNDAAVIMFARQGAEGTDVKMDDVDDDGVTPKSALALTQNEEALLKRASEDFDKVIVLINTPNQMETWEIEKYADAILYVGMPGLKGFTGVANILKGTVNPSGHLVDTYAKNSLSAPAVVNSGTTTPEYANVDEINNTIGAAENAKLISIQVESIYIGYRYYETRYEDAVIGGRGADNSAGASFGNAKWNYADEVSYTFGHGLSYTTFKQTLDSVTYDAATKTYTIKATVTNTGDVPGKGVIQLYAQTPYGEYEKANLVEKSAVALMDFAKSKELKPGESEQLTMTVDQYLLASYDYKNAKTYILSEGDYYFAVGADAHDALNNILAAKGYTTADGMTANGDASKTYKFTYNAIDTKTYSTSNGYVVTNQFDDCDINYWIPNTVKYVSRQDWAGTYPKGQTTVAATKEMMDILDGNTYVKPSDAPTYDEVVSKFGKDSGLTLVMMKDVPYEDDVTWTKFLLQMSIDDLANATAESFSCPAVGTLSPAFAVGDGCDSIGGSMKATDSEDTIASLRYCSNNIYVGTFNKELIAKRGTLLGEEGLFANLMQSYNTGLNLHRTPFGGRNFEYMSECPMMDYICGAIQVTAMQETGSNAAPKHFAGNDQETAREGVSTFYTEQGLREGALRAFEGALKVAKAKGLMQSFSRQGLEFTSAKKAMNVAVLRNEWGWTGNVVTDACPGNKSLGVGYKNHTVEMLEAGSQQFCLDGQATHGKLALQYAKDTNDGHIVELMLQAAKDWEYAISRSCIINGMSANAIIVQVTPWWQTALTTSIIVVSILTAGAAALYVLGTLKKED